MYDPMADKLRLLAARCGMDMPDLMSKLFGDILNKEYDVMIVELGKQRESNDKQDRKSK